MGIRLDFADAREMLEGTPDSRLFVAGNGFMGELGIVLPIPMPPSRSFMPLPEITLLVAGATLPASVPLFLGSDGVMVLPFSISSSSFFCLFLSP